MKTCRIILVLSLFITIISLFAVLIIFEGLINNIFLAFMGSSFVSFLLEIPNYFKMKSENSDRLYGSLYSIKVHAKQLKNIIENLINTNSNVVINMNEALLNQIIIDFSVLQSVDSFLFLGIKKKYLSDIIIDINIKKDNLQSSIIDYEIAYNYILVELNKNNISNNIITIIPANMVEKNLLFVSKMCEELIEGINDQCELIFTKKMKSKWIIGNQTISNMTARFKKDKN